MIKFWIERLGEKAIHYCHLLGRLLWLLGRILCSWQVKSLFIFFKELSIFAFSALPLMVVCGLFIGMVLGLEGYHSLIHFHAENSLGALVAISLLREIGPVLAALFFSSSIGSALSSEIGLMKASDQLLALKSLGINVLDRVIAPRFWAGIVAMPLLALIVNAVAILGCYWVVVKGYASDASSFWYSMHQSLHLGYDLGGSILKSLCFGGLVTLVALFNGLSARPTPAGILKATNQTVVWSSVGVVVVDLVLTLLLFMR